MSRAFRWLLLPSCSWYFCQGFTGSEYQWRHISFLKKKEKKTCYHVYNIMVTFMRLLSEWKKNITDKSNCICLLAFYSIPPIMQNFICLYLIFSCFYTTSIVTIFNDCRLLHFLDHKMLLILRYTVAFLTTFHRSEVILPL